MTKEEQERLVVDSMQKFANEFAERNGVEAPTASIAHDPWPLSSPFDKPTGRASGMTRGTCERTLHFNGKPATGVAFVDGSTRYFIDGAEVTREELAAKERELFPMRFARMPQSDPSPAELKALMESVLLGGYIEAPYGSKLTDLTDSDVGKRVTWTENGRALRGVYQGDVKFRGERLFAVKPDGEETWTAEEAWWKNLGLRLTTEAEDASEVLDSSFACLPIGTVLTRTADGWAAQLPGKVQEMDVTVGFATDGKDESK